MSSCIFEGYVSFHISLTIMAWCETLNDSVHINIFLKRDFRYVFYDFHSMLTSRSQNK